MPTTKKKKTAAKKAVKKRAPAKKTKAKAKPSNVISFSELFELKKKKMAEAQLQQQQVWKDGTTGTVSVYNEQPKTFVDVRNGRTNGAGTRHK